MDNKQYGSVSIDVDTLEFDRFGIEFMDLSGLSYAKFLPRFLCFCDRCGIKAAFFIVAKHALNKKNSKIIKMIANNGHEIANHTLNYFKHFCLFKWTELTLSIS